MIWGWGPRNITFIYFHSIQLWAITPKFSLSTYWGFLTYQCHTKSLYDLLKTYCLVFLSPSQEQRKLIVAEARSPISWGSALWELYTTISVQGVIADLDKEEGKGGMTQQTHQSPPAPQSQDRVPSLSTFICTPLRSSSPSPSPGVHSQVTVKDLSTFLDWERWDKIKHKSVSLHLSIAAQINILIHYPDTPALCVSCWSFSWTLNTATWFCELRVLVIKVLLSHALKCFISVRR